MPHKIKLLITKDQLRLTLTMLVLVVIGGLLLYAWSFRSKKLPALPEGDFVTLAVPTAGVLTEKSIASLPDDPELLLRSSSDGESFAYIEKGGEGRRVVLNGEPGPYYDSITFLGFSPDGRNLAYTAKENNKEFAVVNGVEGKHYDWIFEPRAFSPDSRYFVYKARDSRGDMIVVNGKESRPYQRIFGLELSEEKNRLSFFARDGRELWRGTVRLDEVTE
ncbi:MAG: hypothetical protein ACM3PZ_03285 [Bacillota bacterium]